MIKQVDNFKLTLWMKILVFLSEKKQYNALQISKMLSVTPCSVYSNLFTLEKKGFTSSEWEKPKTYWNSAKNGKKERGRGKTITLTKKGDEMIMVLKKMERLLESTTSQ